MLEGFDDDGGVRIVGSDRSAPLLIVCEHGGNAIPARYGDLGLSDEAGASHAAWDPGALEVAEALAELLNAPLVAQTTSRLVYDCNRPPGSADAMRSISEAYGIPGNDSLGDEARAERIASVYEPFVEAVAHACDVLEARAGEVGALVTVHSFTPVFDGRHRSVEIGALHGSDARLANAFLAVAGADGGYDVRRNAPYGPSDGVLHTLDLHAVPRRLPNLMIEVRNDLIAAPEACRSMAERLAVWLSHALSQLER